MSTEQNKALATEFFNRFSVGDFDGILATLTEDATWRIPGKPELTRIAGPKTKEQMAAVFKAMAGQLKGGLKMAIKGMIAEGDQVALEAESLGELRNGRVYNNEYHMLMTMRGGKISAVREYYDTQHVFMTWFQP